MPASAEGLADEIRRLSAVDAERPDPETQRRLVLLRHLLGIRRLDSTGRAPWPEPAFDRLPGGDGLPEFAPDELTPELLRAGILTHGCLLVRGLVPRDAALELADGIDRAFAAREAAEAGRRTEPGLYEEFRAEPPFVGLRLENL